MTTTPPPLPAWAEAMRRAYQSGSHSQFLLYGGVHDLVPLHREAGTEYVALRHFLTEAMFAPFDVVIHYDRGRGVRVRKGGDHFHGFLKAFDTFRGTSWSALGDQDAEAVETLNLANQLPRDPLRALEVVDRFLRAAQHRTLPDPEGGGGKSGARKAAPLAVAVLVEYTQFLVPRGEPIHYSSDLAQVLIRLIDWGSDPALTQARVATVLIADSLADVNAELAESPYAEKIALPLPDAASIHAYVQHLTADKPSFDSGSEVSREVLAEKLVGLTLVNVRSLLLRALGGGEPITADYLSRRKKELIEKEAMGRISFIESRRTLDDVAGHEEAKAWLRQDAELLRKGLLRSIPMGYLLCGRIGTGKTFLVECWAGEVGIPVVEIKNFRERWVGATEGNLEKIFQILHALGQVVVFVDEADQATGRRDSGSGDSGLSGRIYGMLAAEMSDTANRGKILWVFATSRPDLVEVDLKRQGRLDVHIPLFPPGQAEARKDLFHAMARKLGIKLQRDELPDPPADEQVGGNEMEGILVRALRHHETQPEPGKGEAHRGLPEVIAGVIEDFRPSAHVERLRLMDLLAVKECTDSRFLPPRFAKLSLAEVNQQIEELKARVGW